MKKWNRFWLIFALAWSLFWIAWMIDIYEFDDIFAFAFMEIALGIPLVFVLIWVFVCRILLRVQKLSTRIRRQDKE